MAILSLSSDELRYDGLKEDNLSARQFDPIGKAESSRVKVYDKELGYALHPEEKEAALTYKGNVEAAAGNQKKAIDTYETAYQKEMKAANAKGAGILSSAKATLAGVKKPSFDLIPIRVVNGNNVEGTYMLPRSVADKLSKEFVGGNETYLSSWVDDGNALNIDARIGGNPYGKELHQSLLDAVEQVKAAQKINDDAYNTAMQAGQIQIESAAKSIESQKSIAEKAHGQQLSQANTVFESIKGKWSGFVTEQQTAFQNGIKTNEGGIRDLIESGALTVKGERG